MGILDALGSMLDFGYTPYKQAERRAALQKITGSDSPDGPNMPMTQKLQLYGDANPGVWADPAFLNMNQQARQFETQQQAQLAARMAAEQAAAQQAEGMQYDLAMADELKLLEGAAYERSLANYVAQAPVGSRYYGKAAELVKAPGDTEIKRDDTLLGQIRGEQATVRSEGRAEARRKAQQQEVLAAPGLGLTGQAAVDYRTKIQNTTRAQQTVTDLHDKLEKMSTGQLAISPSERATFATAVQADMLPYLQQRFQAGAMQQGEQELFTELAGNPTAIFSWTPKQRAILKYWMADTQRTRENLYGLAKQAAPPLEVGQSVVTRSQTPVQPQGRTRPYVPGGAR